MRVREGPHRVGGSTYWLESRPHEGGRSVLLRADSAGRLEVLAGREDRIGSALHGYGGGSFCAFDEAIVYVQSATQALVVVREDSPRILTEDHSRFVYGDLLATSRHRRVLAVRESRERRGGRFYRAIVAIALDDSGTEVLVDGADFYAFARMDPAGERLAFMTWNHPDMPWDRADVWTVSLDASGAISGDHVHVAGPLDDGTRFAASQPTWRLDGSLVYLSDKSGWSVPYSWSPGGATTRLCDTAIDVQGPMWQAGVCNLCETDEGLLLAVRHNGSFDEIGIIKDRSFMRLDTSFSDIATITGTSDGVLVAASSPAEPSGVWRLRIDERSQRISSCERLSDAPPRIARRRIRSPQSLKVAGGPHSVHALVYDATQRRRSSPPPPAVVHVHGGPTGSAKSSFDPVVQFFVSNGISVIAVDYRGSTGYGTAYRRALEGEWGVADVDDCARVVHQLGESGRIDPTRVAIRGSSSGGATALQSLARTTSFRCAVAYSAVCDLEKAAHQSVDFESHYFDRLVGPIPESIDLYTERSPLALAGLVDQPVLLFHGIDDVIVPISQARAMKAALEAVGVDVTLRTFDGEGHSFRGAQTKQTSLVDELTFYRRHLI